jgi:DNA-binding transcriptional regulator YdaS (Cro superfamily)
MFDLLHVHVSSLLQQFQISEGVEQHSSCSIDSATGEELDRLHSRPASSFEHSFGGESFSDNSQCTSGKFTFLFFVSLNMMMIWDLEHYSAT